MSVFQNYHAKFKKCTDIFWLFLFIVFLIILITIAVFAIMYGNYFAIKNGYDSFGNICGVEYNKPLKNITLSGIDTSNKSYLLYFDYNNFATSVIKLCIEKCPEEIIVDAEDLYDYYKLTNIPLCRYDFNMSILIEETDDNFSYMNRLGPCPVLSRNLSLSVKNRCVPFHTKAYGLDTHLNSDDLIQLFFMYIYLTWHYIAALSGVALLISLILIIMMRWLTRVASCVICLLVIIANVVLCVELWYVYGRISTGNELTDELEDFLINNQVIYAGAIFVSVTMIVLVIVLFFLRKQVFNLKMVFDEAAHCLAHFPRLLIVSSITLLVLILSFSFSLHVMICTTTTKKPEIEESDWNEHRPNNEFRSFQRVAFVESKSIRSSFWVYIVGFIWTTEFIIACEEFTLGAFVVYWYFRRPINSPLTFTVRKLLKYHLGTVIKGSIAITLLKIPRLILIYLCKKLKKNNGYSFCNYRVGLLEEWIGMLNHNAYSVVAIKGIDYSPAARIAWHAMARSALQVERVNGVADFVLFSAKLFVAIVVCMIGIVFLKDVKDLYFYMAPVIISTVLAFLIAHVVFALLEMIIDTLFLCICEDKHIYGYGGRWTRSNLAEILRNKETEQGIIQVISIQSCDRQPFRSTLTQ